MKKLLICGLALTSTLFNLTMARAESATASPNVVGIWNVTFYLEPGRGTGATQCIVFKSVPGIVAGVPTSGTWTSPTFPGWSGQWIQLGDHVRWFGVTSSLATTESGNLQGARTFGGVSFNHFAKSNAATSSAGSWTAVRVASCARYNTANEDDPSKDASPANNSL